MSWRSRLQTGSFRDVTFHTETAGGSGGRRVAVHEYPQQEEHWSEDIGQATKTDTIDIYIIGADYDTQRNKLFEALDKPGSGTLVHPYLGSIEVQIGQYTWTISHKKGGYCQVSIEYTRAGKRQFPVDKQQNAKFLMDCCSVAKAGFQSDFLDQFSLAGQPAFVLQAAVNQLSSIRNMFKDLQQLGRFFDSTINDDDPDYTQLIQQSTDLADNLTAVVFNTFDSTDSTTDAFVIYENVVAGLSVDDPVTPAFTPSRKQQQSNQQAINQLVTGLVTVESATTLAARDADFVTYQQAMDTQASLLAVLDTLIDSSTAKAYFSLANLQTAIIKRVDDIAPGLQQIEQIQIAQSVPALVLAHKLYQSSDKAAELIQRNQINHPLFVPAGIDLEVLS